MPPKKRNWRDASDIWSKPSRNRSASAGVTSRIRIGVPSGKLVFMGRRIIRGAPPLRVRDGAVPNSITRTWMSVEDFARLHAPQRAGIDPAAIATCFHQAPVGAAFAQPSDHAQFGTGAHGTRGIGANVERQHVRLDDGRTNPRQERVMHPAADAVTVDDAPPVPVFSHD